MSGDDIERIAWDLIARFGDLAAPIARELTTPSDEAQDEMLLSAEAWRDVITAIERLLLKPRRIALSMRGSRFQA